MTKDCTPVSYIPLWEVDTVINLDLDLEPHVAVPCDFVRQNTT